MLSDDQQSSAQLRDDRTRGSGRAAAMRLSKGCCDGDSVSASTHRAWLQRSNHKGAGATEGERRPSDRIDGGRRDGEDIQLVGGAAGGIEVIALVPGDAADGVLGKDSGVRGDGLAPVEMENLKTRSVLGVVRIGGGRAYG